MLKPLVLAVALLPCLPVEAVTPIAPEAPPGIDRDCTSLEPAHTEARVDRIRRELFDADGERVLVVAHRGDWRNAPENSLRAIQNCIKMGVDIVEIDVRMTKDRSLVLMHDETLDRTSTGSGSVWDFNLKELKRLRLKNGQGIPTRHRIPTLEEALTVARGRIMVNLDKCYDVFPQVHAALSATDTLDHALLKGWQVSPAEFRKEYGNLADDVLFMPIIDLSGSGAKDLLDACRQGKPPVAFEFIFEHEPEGLTKLSRALRQDGSRVWLNSLWPFFNAGHDDDRAVDDPDGSYGWLVASGANIIQTDRPHMLIRYLRSE